MRQVAVAGYSSHKDVFPEASFLQEARSLWTLLGLCMPEFGRYLLVERSR